jgi:hypothetical protein
MSVNAFNVKNSLLLKPLASAPSSPSNGEIYYNSVSNTFQFYQNGSFSSLSSTAITSLTGDVTATGPGAAAATLASSISGAKTFTTSLSSAAFISTSANVAAAGLFRLSNSDGIYIRNAGNTADLILKSGSSDAIPQYNGIDLANLSTSQTLSNKTLTAPTINGGTHTAVTNFALRDTSAAFDVTLAATSSTTLTGARTLTIDTNNVSSTLKMGANLTVTSAATLSGTNTGDQTITLTGDVTGSGTGSFAATIASNAVTNAKLAQMAAHTYKGNNTGSTANAADITSTQLTADLNLFSSSLQGLVPASGGGTTNFLRADGTFAAPSGGSAITSLTGDVTATGPGAAAATLATVNSNVGSFTNASITVNAKGLVTAASSGSASGGGIGGGGFVNVTTTYNATSADNNKILLSTTTAPYTITLPPHAANQIITVKDISGQASTNNLTIARNGGTGNIEGFAGSKLLQADFGSMTFFDDGTNWWIIV